MPRKIRTPKEKSVAEKLAARGYGHRSAQSVMNIGEHEIYRVSDDVAIGSAFADEALALVDRVEGGANGQVS